MQENEDRQFNYRNYEFSLLALSLWQLLLLELCASIGLDKEEILMNEHQNRTKKL